MFLSCRPLLFLLRLLTRPVLPPQATRARKGLYWCQDINNESDLSACMLPGKQVEDQHVLAATAIKKVNPDAVVISYLNSIIQYPWCE